MIKIENTEVFGWNAAIRGLRNPLNSWAKSDSYWSHIENPETENTAPFEFFLGENDLNLMKKLVKSGSDHAKFLRMIHVQCDITAPMYWVAEHDTYKVSTVRNSCSFMHKGVSKPFTIDDFSIAHPGFNSFMEANVEVLNKLRDKYLEVKDPMLFETIRQYLPAGYNIRYTWDANYAVLQNIYFARRNHRLPEWHTFCDWIETLPYFKEVVLDAET